MKRKGLKNCWKFPEAHEVLVTLIISALPGFPTTLLTQEREPNDREIAGHLTREFWNDESISANTIEAESQNGIVTLSGLADNIIAKERAEKIAEATVGVRGVINRIRVNPPMTLTDEKVEQSVRNALRRNPATEICEVGVEVAEGIVTPQRTVDSSAEKQLCGDVAQGIRGIWTSITISA